MRYNRREFTAALAATVTLPSLTAGALEVRGVELGLQSYTFHQVRKGGPEAVATMIAAMKQLNVDLCELWAPQVAPFALPAGYWQRWSASAAERSAAPNKPTAEQAKADREALRAWRVNPPAGYFEGIRRQFHAGGVRLFAYNYSFDPSMTDAELDAGFTGAKQLGVDLITASSRVSDAKRLVPFAAKHNMRVAFHGHAAKGDPDQVAGPETFLQVLAMSPLYRVNLDVAHYASAGFDSVAFLNEHHDKITNLHLHDRKANDGDSVPYGEGVAPARDVLHLLRDKGWKIPVFYELEYVGGDGRDVIAETARELDYEKKLLAS